MALVVSVPIGLFSGYRGGKVDNVIMRIMDALSSVPALVLALAIVGVLGPGLTNTSIAIAIAVTPGFVRFVRGQTLAVRQETFVEASHSLGTRERTILRKRILPSVASPLIVTVALASGAVLIAESGLSLLGLGSQPPESSWGSMLQRGYQVILTHPWQVIVPGTALALTVLAFNLLGDGLRDALGLGVPKATGLRGRLGLTTVTAAPQSTPAPTPTGDDGASPLLTVSGLTVEFVTEAGPVTVVEDVGFSVAPGEVLGIVGESGSGKSVTSLSIMRLIPSPPGRIVRGSVVFDGRDLLTLPFAEMRKVRGNDISMVFQDPMTSLNPAYTVGNLLGEAVRLHQDVNRAGARARALELLELVGIPDPKRRLDDYPHQLSGGMRQRVLIAMALSSRPRLLIADEPTTALDVTVQAQILDLLRSLQAEFGMAIIFVTHDLGVVADLCDRVLVMYAGQVVEQATVTDLFDRPRHPYTQGLLRAMPQVAGRSERLVSIRGTVPPPTALPAGCRFHPRCDHATDACRAEPVELLVRGDRPVRCVLAEELVP
jgi:peptide/nickel transport system permease protein